MAEPDKKSLFESARPWWTTINRYLGIFAVVGFGIALIAEQITNLPTAIRETLVVMAGLGLFGFLFEVSSRLSGQEQRITDSIKRLSQAQTRLEQELSQTATIGDCYKHLISSIEERVSPGQEVVLDHIGLDMSNAKDHLYPLLASLPNDSVLTIRLFALVNDPGRLDRNNVPEEVKGWCQNHARGLSGYLDTHCEQLSNKNARVILMLWDYADVPSVHGWAVRSPFSAYYISWCHWSADNGLLPSTDGVGEWPMCPAAPAFRWGENEYRIFDGAPLTSEGRQLVRWFNGRVRNLFMNAGDPVMRTSVPGEGG